MTQAADHHLRPSLLDDGRKLAALAGVAFLISLFLPWFQKSVLPTGAQEFVTTSLTAFGAFSWIEAALLLVDAAVLVVLYLRSTGRRVELPADDGTMIAFAGGWMLFLLIVRVVFAKPEVTGGVAGTAPTVGLQWGLLVAMGAAGGMLASGLASRAIEHHTRTHPVSAPDDELESEVPARWRRPRSDAERS